MTEKILVTGSAGHLGEALLRTLANSEYGAVGIDIKASDYTHHVGSIVDRDFVRHCMVGVDAVIHTATLHKPHVETHSKQSFIDTNITGTLNLLEEAVSSGVSAFVYTSTTSAFGDAMQHQLGEPAVWVKEELQAIPKNIYGLTKTAAEGFCELFARKHRLPCVVLRTSRFFPEQDDNRSQRDAYDDDNLKVNELLFRRADIQDIVDAHLLAVKKISETGFDRFIISATPPFNRDDLRQLGVDAPSVVQAYYPEYPEIFGKLGWSMFSSIGRVYDSAHATSQLDWKPQYTFQYALECLKEGISYRSPLANLIGAKGYHDMVFEDGPYPVDRQI